MNIYEVQALSDEQLRIKVATLLGTANWQYCEDLYGPDPYLDAPNYPKDLNDCHKMEESLTSEQLTEYANTLGSGFTGANRGQTDKAAATHATARQRCEAFVLTMETVKQ